MLLEDISKKIGIAKEYAIERLENLKILSLSFIISSHLDSLSTSLCLSNKVVPIDNERNPFARYLMQNFGIDVGLSICNFAVVPTVIGLAYFFNNWYNHGDELILNEQYNLQKNSIKNLGVYWLLSNSLMNLNSAMNNFSMYLINFNSKSF